MAPFPKAAARAVALATAILAAPGGRATGGDIEVSWDPDLAFEWDRASYERTLREMVRAADEEVSSWLGWRRSRPLAVRVMTRAQYEARFGSAMAWNSGAHYSRGVIHVNGGARLDGWFAGMLAHETTHGLLDDRGTGGRLPAWLNEGLAERLAYRTRGQHDLTTGQVQELEIALEQRRLVPLSARAVTRFTYLQGFAAVLFLEKKIGKERLLAVARRVLDGGTFEQALDAELRWTVKAVEEGFSYWVDHLQ